jgi:CMP/dCMP kinase
MSIQIITIDGPSASGKGAFGMLIASKLGSSYLDTGLLFRATALLIQKNKKENPISWDLDFFLFLKSNIKSCLAEDSIDLRSSATGELASQLSTHLVIRDFLLHFQKEWAEQCPPWSVVDGRDCGSTVFPDAAIKIYITARPEVRAFRRHQQLISAGENISFSIVLDSLNKRDLRDSTRKYSPLIIPEEAYVFDNSDLSFEESSQMLMKFIESRLTS